MKHSPQLHEHMTPTRGRGPHYTISVIALALGMSVLGACSDVSALTKERVAQSQVAVQQAQQNIGQAEVGAVELQRAKQHMEAANSALAKGLEKEAERSAVQARLQAELAVAKAQSAAARRAADEVLASTNTLRQEIERNTPTTR